MVGVSRGVNCTMVEYLRRRLNTVLAKYIVKIFQFYKNNGYTAQTFLMGREIECICDSLPEEENINKTVEN